jgi:hypothetical protein
LTVKHLLQQAKEEILQLRRQNEVLSAKVETMELFALVLRTQPSYTGMTMGEDIAWMLAREIQRIEDESRSTIG